MILTFTCLSHAQQNTNGWFWVNGQAQANNLNWVKIMNPTHYYAVGENGTFAEIFGWRRYVENKFTGRSTG
ncbi:MAG: hypothetical protein R3A12_17195 [Ignavibacteria bacterium]